jgi:acyl carrier protein
VAISRASLPWRLTWRRNVAEAALPLQTKEDILARVVELLSATFELDKTKIRPDSDLYGELGIDSIDAIDLLIKLQELTDKRIQPAAFKQTRTVRDVVDTVFALQEP